MSSFIEYAAFAGAIIGSIGLALVLEWVSLHGLFRVMPGRLHQPVSAASATKNNEPPITKR